MTPPTSALARIARDASRLPLAGDAYAVAWLDARGNWHTAFCDAADVPQGAGYAIARDGELIEIETTMERRTA